MTTNDKRLRIDNNSDNLIDSYLADDLSKSDYYPYGMAMVGRNTNLSDYRFGYQGSEMDNEFDGSAGSHYTTYFRQLDPRLGRWMSIDPVVQPWQSPYTSMDCNPIKWNDVNGDAVGVIKPKSGGVVLTDRHGQKIVGIGGGNGKLGGTIGNLSRPPNIRLFLTKLFSSSPVNGPLDRSRELDKSYVLHTSKMENKNGGWEKEVIFKDRQDRGSFSLVYSSTINDMGKEKPYTSTIDVQWRPFGEEQFVSLTGEVTISGEGYLPTLVPFGPSYREYRAERNKSHIEEGTPKHGEGEGGEFKVIIRSDSPHRIGFAMQVDGSQSNLPISPRIFKNHKKNKYYGKKKVLR